MKICAGELGPDANKLENSLTLIFDLANRWEAILLLDEADVFLESRASGSLVNNALVTVFLRKLEYYQGIVFLTTNRVTSFDPAIVSRVHFPLRFENLKKVSRQNIWSNFLDRADTEYGAANVCVKV